MAGSQYNEGMYEFEYQSLLGASISRQKSFGFRHRGTCVDPACHTIVDPMPPTGPRLVSRPFFADGYPITIDSLGLTPLDQQLRAHRSLNQIGRFTYAQANCDVLATYAETGQVWSPQLVKAFVGRRCHWWYLLAQKALKRRWGTARRADDPREHCGRIEAARDPAELRSSGSES